jgi:hypothetical protein
LPFQIAAQTAFGLFANYSFLDRQLHFPETAAAFVHGQMAGLDAGGVTVIFHFPCEFGKMHIKRNANFFRRSGTQVMIDGLCHPVTLRHGFNYGSRAGDCITDGEYALPGGCQVLPHPNSSVAVGFQCCSRKALIIRLLTDRLYERFDFEGERGGLYRNRAPPAAGIKFRQLLVLDFNACNAAVA